MIVTMRAMLNRKIPRRGFLDWIRVVWLLVVLVVLSFMAMVVSVSVFREGPLVAWPIVMAILIFMLAFAVRVTAFGVYGDDNHLYIAQVHRTVRVPWGSIRGVRLVPVPILHRVDPTRPQMVAVQTQDGREIRIASMISHVWPAIWRPKGEEWLAELKAEVRAHGGEV